MLSRAFRSLLPFRASPVGARCAAGACGPGAAAPGPLRTDRTDYV